MTDTARGWQPGRPVLSEQDAADWRAWRKARALDLQRQRRRSPSYLRIDFYAYGPTADLIRSMVSTGEASCYAAAIDRIIAEWAEAHPEFRN